MSSVVRSDPGGLVPGEQLAGYQVQEQIGRGGMAVVYRALDLRLGRLVALKVLAPDLGEDEAFRQRFIRESRAAAGVDHPNIVPVFEAGEAGGVLFIAMRYVGHGDLRSLIDAEGRLSPARAAAITGQVASALDAAHVHGLVHRDVKPGNILLGQADGDFDHVYLSDFGLSKHSLTPSTLTSTGQFLGTLDYVSPEQIQGRPVDGRADQYALACAAVEMLTGAPPFRRDDTMALMFAQLQAEPPRLTERRPELSPAVDEVIAAAMAKAPADRYPTCRDFAMALSSACAQPGRIRTAAADVIAATPPPLLPPSPVLPMAPSQSPAPHHSPRLQPQAEHRQDPRARSRQIPGAQPRGDAARSAAPPRPGSDWSGSPLAGSNPGPESPDVLPSSWDGRVSGRVNAFDAASDLAGGPASPRPDADFGGGFVAAAPARLAGAPAGRQPAEPRHGSRRPAAGSRRRRTAAAIVIVLVALAGLAGLGYKLLYRPAATSPPPAAATTPTASGHPARTVRAYFAAINHHHYLQAWKLSGEREKLATFEAGYAGTAHDAVTIVRTQGDVVTASLVATQTDGTVKTFQGTYTVVNGTISTADVRQVG